MRQTTRLGGKRVTIHTSAKGKVTVKPAPHTEDELQEAQVTALRRHPAYAPTEREADARIASGLPAFTFAASLEAERRGPRARSKALRTGMMAGEPDLRLSFSGGRLAYVENKVGNARFQSTQEPRHALLRRLGFVVHVIRATTPDEAVSAILAIVNAALSPSAAANDNKNDNEES